MTSQALLLVEDNDNDAELTMMAFERSQIVNPVVRVRDGVEALEYLTSQGEYKNVELPVVVLLDLKLPRVDGLEVLKRIRSTPRTRHLPVVILTSSGEDGDRLQAYAHHANSYVQKPVDYDAFVVASRQLGLYWTTVNKPAPASE